MSVSLKDIAAATGFSISTVSRVLSSKIGSNSKSGQSILKAARDMGYEKYRSSVDPQDREIDIALITQHYSEEFYAYLYSGFDQVAINNNCSLTIHSVRHVSSLKEHLLYLSKSYDGFIIFLPTLDPYNYNKLNDALEGYPIVSIAPSMETIFDTFTFDSYQGGILAAESFLGGGFEKFGIINGPQLKWEAALRKNGFCDTVRNAGCAIDWEYGGDYSFESGECAFHDVIKNRIKKIGIFASNDQMAVGFIHAGLENNAKIPGDFSIIGYDNILFSKIFYPKLTTINTDVNVLADETIDFLKRKIKGETRAHKTSRKTLIPVQLVKRDTHLSI